MKVQSDDSHHSEISLDVCRQLAKLDASHVHFTEDWEGDRILLVAFHVKGSERMPQMDLQRCLDLGFVVVPSAGAPPAPSALRDSPSDVETVFVGVPHSPEEFHQEGCSGRASNGHGSLHLPGSGQGGSGELLRSAPAGGSEAGQNSSTLGGQSCGAAKG